MNLAAGFSFFIFHFFLLLFFVWILLAVPHILAFRRWTNAGHKDQLNLCLVLVELNQVERLKCVWEFCAGLAAAASFRISRERERERERETLSPSLFSISHSLSRSLTHTHTHTHTNTHTHTHREAFLASVSRSWLTGYCPLCKHLICCCYPIDDSYT